MSRDVGISLIRLTGLLKAQSAFMTSNVVHRYAARTTSVGKARHLQEPSSDETLNACSSGRIMLEGLSLEVDSQSGVAPAADAEAMSPPKARPA